MGKILIGPDARVFPDGPTFRRSGMAAYARTFRGNSAWSALSAAARARIYNIG
jgi:hypothetical protein